MSKETKHYVAPLELKSLDEADGTFTGYGAVYGNKDSYGDIIVKGAFDNYLVGHAAKEVKLLWQHDSRMPIGVYDEVRSDDNGLYVKGRLLINDVEKAREAYALLKAGAISGLSIGFSIDQGGSEFKDNALYLKQLSLWEISLVTFPANDKANVSSVKTIETIRDFENFLRDVGGFSASQAKRIAVQGYKAIGGQRDVDAEEAEALLVSLKKLHQSIKG
jgi:HK97 family phage prohead protease